METPKKRRSRHVRVNSTPPDTISPRQLDILEALYLRRAATTEQIAQLVFGYHENSYVSRQVRALFHDTFIHRRFLTASYGILTSKIIHMLDKEGAKRLSHERGYRVKWAREHLTIAFDTIQHTLALNDTEIAFRKGCKALGYQITKWIGESAIKADYDRISVQHDGKTETKAVQPDMYMAISAADELSEPTFHFLFEEDKGTEVRKQFSNKIPTYLAYFKSKECKARYGTNRLRVLVVTTSERRLANIKRYTEAAGGKSRFWFTTHAQLDHANPFISEIWQIAGREGNYSLLYTPEEKGIAFQLATPFLRLSTHSSFH
jgi:hypothetical protein